MPAIDQLYAQYKSAGPQASGIDDLFDDYKKVKPSQPSIYSKGGIYDQFGPNPRVFNPLPGKFGGMVQTGADQPGAALPFVGQAAGGTVAGPAGGVVGALAGEGVRQGVGRLFGVQDEGDPRKQFKAAGEAAVKGELFGFGVNRFLRGAERMIEGAKPGAKQYAIRSAQNIIRPTGRLAKKGSQIAETSLKENVLSRNLPEMKSKVGVLKTEVENQVDDLITQYQDRTITAEGALKRMDALSRRYRQLGDSNSAARVDAIKNDLIQAQGLRQPVTAEVETSQFLMGPASKQVTPQITETYSSDIRGPLKSLKGKSRYESVRTKSGKFGRSEPKREIFTPKKNVESPEDIVAMNIPKRGGASTQKIVSVSPKETYQIRPETKGPSRKQTAVIGTEPRQIPIKEAQAIKRGQYRLLEGKKVGGGYGSETFAPEIAARQQYAGGFRREVSKQIPEIDPANKRFGNIIDLENAVMKRMNVADRNDLLSIKDVILATNPKAWPLLLARKAGQALQAPAAQSLYRFGTSGPIQLPQVSPAIRALLSSQMREN